MDLLELAYEVKCSRRFDPNAVVVMEGNGRIKVLYCILCVGKM